MADNNAIIQPPNLPARTLPAAAELKRLEMSLRSVIIALQRGPYSPENASRRAANLVYGETGLVPGSGDSGGAGAEVIGIPTAPTGFTVTGAFSVIILDVDPPSYPGHFYTEFYRNAADDLGNAVKVGDTTALVYADTPPSSSLSQTYYYWCRHVNKNGVPGPFNAQAGTPGSTADDPTYVLEILTGEILGSHLHSSLSTPIGSIPDIAQDIIDLQAAFAALAGEVVGSVFVQDAEPVPGVGGIPDPIPDNSRWYDSNDNLHPYIWMDPGTGDEWVDLQDPRIGQNAAAITILQADLTTAEGDIVTNAGALATLDATVIALDGTVTGVASDVTQLETDLATANGLISGNASAISTLQSTVSQQGDDIAASAVDITNLQSDVTNLSGGQDAHTTAIDALQTSVSQHGTEIDANASSIVSLQADLTAAENGVAVNAGAVTALDARVTTNEGDISSNASDVTALDARVTTNEGDVAGNAGAITALDVRVTGNEGDISSQASDITALQASVGDNEAAILAEASARADADSAIASDVTTLQATVGAIQTLTLINPDGFLTLTGNSAKKTGGSGSSWDAQAYSEGSHKGAAYAMFRPKATNKAIIAGLNTDPGSGPGPSLLDYGLYLTTGGGLFYIEGASSGSLGVSYAVGDDLAVTYDGAQVVYTKNGVVLRTIAAAGGLNLSFDSVFYSADGEIEGIEFNSGVAIAVASAAIQTEATARANADDALALDITTVQATAGDNTAAIQTEATARANADGLAYAEYTIKLNANGKIAGIGLSVDGGASGPISSLVEVLADVFAIAHPSDPGEPDVVPFVVSGGKVYMDVALIEDATITNAKIANLAVDNAKIANLAVNAAKIANATITAAKIANATITNAQIANATIQAAKIALATITNAQIANATIQGAKIANAAINTLQLAGQSVTVPVSAYTAAAVEMDPYDAIVQQVSIDSEGQPVHLFVSMFFIESINFSPVVINIYRDATLIFTAEPVGGLLLDENNDPYPVYTLFSYSLKDTPGAGTHTYYVKAGGGSTSYAKQRSLLALGTKR